MRPVVAEGLGTALLLAIVVGSGIMAQRLSAGNDAVALLANAVATGAGLFALITLFAPISGAHFNPAVSLAAVAGGALAPRHAAGYLLAQIAGAVAGVLAAHFMFSLPLFQLSAHSRATAGEALGEVIATFGLVLIVRLSAKAPLAQIAGAVALWITAAYWFTSSTSFANPAVTFARALTDTFAGIAPGDVPAFVAAQALGATAAVFVGGWLERGR
jgi:glycerol uptake facilitator-like aquaporin